MKSLPEQAEHAAGLAVEAAPEPEDLVLARRRLREPQRRLDRLGAAGEELDAREPAGRDAGEQLQEPRARLRREAAEGQALDLSLERVDVVGVAVADAADPMPAMKSMYSLPSSSMRRAAFAARDGQPGVEREGLDARGDVALLARDDRPRARSRSRAGAVTRAAPRNRTARCAAMRSAASSR